MYPVPCQELQQLSANYRSLPAIRRGPGEITVSGSGVRDGAAGAGAGAGAGERRDAGFGAGALEEPAAVPAGAAEAANATAVPEVPALASVLHHRLGVSKDKVKHLLLKWPVLLEVSLRRRGFRPGTG